MTNAKPAARLAASLLCAAMLVLPACSRDSGYSDQAAAIDPALQRQAAEQPAAVSDPDKATTELPTAAMNNDDTNTPAPDNAAPRRVELTDAQWREILSDEEYRILRRSGTEYAGTGRYLDNDASEKGAYHCAGCGNKLYDASHKFHSGCGWPSFFQETEPGAITTLTDRSHGMLRTEMRCAVCDGHLGHIFNDAPNQPTGLRHCVNGTALIFVPEGQDPQAVIRAHREANAGK